MSVAIDYVEAQRLHGMYDVRHDFVSGVNVIYGRNGVGKTTLLHILANALPGHYQQFVYLQFSRIVIGLAGGPVVQITRESQDDAATVTAYVDGRPAGRWIGRRSTENPRRGVVVRSRPAKGQDQPVPAAGEVSYFPAFRSVLDARGSANRSSFRQLTATEFARDLFGRFVPEISYPSLAEIDQRLGAQIGAAFRQISAVETSSMTRAAIDVYKGALHHYPTETRTEAELTVGINQLCERIGAASDLLGRRAENDLSALKQVAAARNATTPLAPDALAVLGMYHDALREVASRQQGVVDELKGYIDAVNHFLRDGRMRLVVSAAGSGRAVIRHDGGKEVSLGTLSSGGRQIVAMMYAAARLSEAPVILIDEPELSLHVDWQRPLLREIAKLTEGKQVVVTTHSPEVSADFDFDSRQVQKFRPSLSPDPLGPDPLLASGDDLTLTRLENEPT